MGKGMKFPFLSHSKSLDPKLSSFHPPWPWPSCVNIKTLSFRATDPEDDNFRTFNSAFLDSETTPSGSFVTVSSSSNSFSTMSEDSGDPLESVIQGLRSDRLFFEPEKSSSLLSMSSSQTLVETEEKGCSSDIEADKDDDKEGKEGETVAYKESEMLSMESENPYEDFRRSMEEMVEAHEVKDWKGLEELLGCYLRINGKTNHGYIVGAFIDLLVSLSFVSFTSSTDTPTYSSSSLLSATSNYSSPSSPLSLPSSSLTTPSLSSALDHDGDDVNHDDDDDDVSS
uniref:Transcription repressor n=1 Tax=Opuntia streptacantha TaxID=393608 RepID=A0A7C9DSN7_OPUST